MSLQFTSRRTMSAWLRTMESIFPRVAVLQRRSNAFGRHVKIMPRIKQMWFDGEMCSKHVDDMASLWRLRLESKETPTPIKKAMGRQREIDGTLMQHDAPASREAAGTSSPATGSSMQEETWLYRRQTDPKTLHAQHSSSAGKHSERACCNSRPSRIRLTNGKSESHGTVRRLPGDGNFCRGIKPCTSYSRTNDYVKLWLRHCVQLYAQQHHA